MSVAALQYIKELAQRPEGRGVSAAEWHVLRALALLHDERVGCCYASTRRLAQESFIAGKDVERRTRLLVAKLEQRGLVLRYAAKRDRDGSQATNEYVLPGLAGWSVAGAEQAVQTPTAPVVGAETSESTAAAAKARRRVFTTARTRLAKQLELPRGALEGAPGRVQKSGICPGLPGRGDPGPPDTGVLPLRRAEETLEETPPPSPCLGAASVEKQATALPGMREAEATARAAATATTGADRAAQAKPSEAGGTGTRSGRPRRGLQLVTAPVGSEAALLEAETERVLAACGVAVSTRRMRQAVSEALRLRVSEKKCGVGEAGDFAVRVWKEYCEAGDLLQWRLGARKFFAEGLWLTPQLWPYDRELMQRMRRRF